MAIDRTREDSDVIERVLGRSDETGPLSEVIDVGIRPWLAGTVTSAVQLTVGAADDHRASPDERPRKDRRSSSLE
jgi:hypothetical protein